MKKTRKYTGFFLVITGSIFWGIGGTVSQKLFQHNEDIDVNWLVATRLSIAGLLLLGIHFLRKGGSQITGIWKTRQTALMILIFGIVGMLGVQYTYMASISYGNAAVATLLQYLAPVMIVLYFILRREASLTKQDVLIILLALAGCFLLLTNGSFETFSIPLPAIIWGLLSAVGLAFYTLNAVPLIKKFDSLVVVGWAMIIGGGSLSLFHAPWQIDLSQFSAETYAYLLFVIVLGTMIAFWFYIESLQYLSPKEASFLSSLEPLAAVLSTVIWLREPFGAYQWAGTVCIILMILILAISKQPASEELKNPGHAD